MRGKDCVCVCGGGRCMLIKMNKGVRVRGVV